MNPEKESNVIRNTILATGLATALVHGYIELETDHGHGPRVELGAMNPFADVETTSEKTVDRPAGKPYRDTITETIDTPTYMAGGAMSANLQVDSEYARKFEADPNAGIFNQESAQEVLGLIEELENDGWNVRVVVSGLASAEDESSQRDGGLQTTSEANQDLADLRGKVVFDHLINAGVNQDMIVMKEGVEDRFDDDQMIVLEGLTEQFGYSSPASLVDNYNLYPEKVPPIVKDTLDTWLKDKRGASVIISASRNEEPQTETSEVEKEVCIVPVIKVTTEIQETENTKMTIPYGVVAPVVGAYGLVMGTTFAGAYSIARSMRKYRKDTREKLSTSMDKDGSGSGEAVIPEDTDPPFRESVEPEVMEPGVFEPKPSDDVEGEPTKEKKRRWPYWLITPVILIGSGLMIKSCLDDGGTSSAPKAPAPASDDGCRNFDQVEKVVDSKTVVIKDGRVQINNRD